MSNWEKKSSYLLREIVKFRTYIDCLVAAEGLKKKVYEERREREAWKRKNSKVDVEGEEREGDGLVGA